MVIGRRTAVVSLAILLGLAVTVAAQRGLRGFGGGRFMPLQSNAPYDGAFRFCRIVFRQSPNGDGDGWSVDYPRADVNLTYRLSELTTTVDDPANFQPPYIKTYEFKKQTDAKGWNPRPCSAG